MAAWLNVAGQALRPVVRRRELWLARIGFALIFAFAAAWAAAAPQAGLSLGQRLRLSFDALVGLCVIVSATSALRHEFAIIDDPSLNLGARYRWLANFASNIAAAAQSLIPAIPLFLFLLALEVISPLELLIAAGKMAAIVVTACAVTNVGVSISLILVAGVVVLTWRLNYFETTIAILFALHLGLKAWVGWSAILRTTRLRKHLNDEAITALGSLELADLHRERLWRELALPMFGLGFMNIAFVFMLVFGVPFPATLEQKLALGLALAGGAALLFADGSALLWRGALSGVTTANPRESYARLLMLIFGAPWAAAWIFSALHSGEAFTLNEGAAYFFMWLGLSGAISWIVRITAKEKLQRDLRKILSEG